MNISSSSLNSISKVLNGVNKSVYVLNELKPIYSDLKPLISKGKELFSKNMGVGKNYINTNIYDKSYKFLENSEKKINGPKFFL